MAQDKDLVLVIAEQRIEFVMRTGIEPTRVYMGRREQKKLLRICEELCTYRMDKQIQGGNFIMGLKIYWVDIPSHMAVFYSPLDQKPKF